MSTPVPPPPPCQHLHRVIRERAITAPRRSKFGAAWLLATLFTFGLALGLYIIWPRHQETIAVDRYAQCSDCGALVPFA